VLSGVLFGALTAKVVPRARQRVQVLHTLVRSKGSIKKGDDMPRFMDFHDDLKLPSEAIEGIRTETKAGDRDKFGVQQVELYHNADGKVYCLLDAPSEQAVRDHHAALGLSVGDVHKVDSLL
jgi:hypothetical protein